MPVNQKSRLEAIFDEYYLNVCDFSKKNSIFALIFNIFCQNSAIKPESIAEMGLRELTSVYYVPVNQNMSIGSEFFDEYIENCVNLASFLVFSL